MRKILGLVVLVGVSTLLVMGWWLLNVRLGVTFWKVRQWWTTLRLTLSRTEQTDWALGVCAIGIVTAMVIVWHGIRR